MHEREFNGPIELKDGELSTREKANKHFLELLDTLGGEVALSTIVDVLAEDLGIRKLDASVIVLEAPENVVEVDLVRAVVKLRNSFPVDAV